MRAGFLQTPSPLLRCPAGSPRVLGTSTIGGPLTVAMCVGVAARIDGTVVHECASGRRGDIRLGHPSGVLPIDATVKPRDCSPWAEKVTVYRKLTDEYNEVEGIFPDGEYTLTATATDGSGHSGSRQE